MKGTGHNNRITIGDLRKLNEEDEKVVENSKESSSEEEDDNDEPFGDFFE